MLTGVAKEKSWASSEAARHSMQANRSRDTEPELQVRHELFRHGLRYRVAYRALPHSLRTVDIAFPGQRIAVLIDGCFWHSCPDHLRTPSTHADFWATKLEATKRRDQETSQMLAANGWLVLRFWEHEDPIEVSRRIEQAVAEAKTPIDPSKTVRPNP